MLPYVIIFYILFLGVRAAWGAVLASNIPG